MLQQVFNTLPRPRNRYTLEKITILTPYVSSKFISDLFGKFPRDNDEYGERLILVIDQNCSTSSIQEIVDDFPKANIRISRTNCLVHAKLYLFDFLNVRNNKHRRIIVFGSLNASQGGWQRNAETFALIALGDIEKNRQSSLKNYFKLIEQGKKVEELLVQIDNFNLYFPSFQIVNYEEVETIDQFLSFDSWLQRGILAHEFKNETFGRFEVKLEGEADSFGNIPNWEARSSRKISFNYTGIELDTQGTEQWKATYFVDTIYNQWTSDACFKKYNGNFIRAGSHARKRQIQCVKRLGKNSRSFERAVKKCINALSELVVYRPNMLQYLRRNEVGILEQKFYKEECCNQLNKQVIKANDDAFSKRQIHGFDFNEVPPLRETDKLWMKFVESYFGDILYKIRRKGKREKGKRKRREISSKQAIVFRDYLELDGSEDWEDVYQDVLKEWGSDNDFREAIIGFFQKK